MVGVSELSDGRGMIVSESRIDEIRNLLRERKKVHVGELSDRFGVSEVSVRKYLAKLEEEGFASRFYGGAALVERRPDIAAGEQDFYTDPRRLALARRARSYISDGDSVFIGSGRSCCVLARQLEGLKNLTVITNNITALPELIRSAGRVILIGGEVTSTDEQTLFSSWESPESQMGSIYVNKAFTSISGFDAKAGLTVDSVISTYIFRQIPSMAHSWFLMVDSSKYGKISVYPVAEITQVDTLITDSVPPEYAGVLDGVTIDLAAEM